MRGLRQSVSTVRVRSVLLLAGALFPAVALAAQLVVNGVAIGKVDLAVQGLEGVTFEKCSWVKVESSGDVRIECPGYDLQAQGASPTPQPKETTATPGKITRKYWIVTEQKEKGMTQFDVDMYVNSRWIRRFKNDDEQIVFEITKHLVPGKNKVLFAPTKNMIDGRRSNKPEHYYRFVVGEGENGGGSVMIESPSIDFQLNATETEATPQSFELLAR